MTAITDKPRLSRAHALELLRQMIRIRRFEEKCAELYTQEKIRGFLHLYDGEEAVAVGVIPALEPRDRIVATYREHGQALVRGVPMTRHWPRCTESRRAAAAAAAARCTSSTAHQLLRRQRHRRRRAAARGRPRARRQHARRGHRHRLLLRRGRGRRRRVPREPEPRRAVAPAGAVRVREQPLRDGHGAGALGIGDRHPAQGGVLPDRVGAVDGMDVVAVGSRRAPRRRRGARGGGPHFLECRTYRFGAIRCSTPSFTATRRRSRPGGTRSPIVRFQGWLEASSHDPCRRSGAHRSRGRRRDRRGRRLRRARHLEPVEELARFLTPTKPPSARRDDRPFQHGGTHLSRGDARGDPRRAAPRRPRCS